MSCARDHTAEFVGSDGVAAPDAEACRRAAEAYLSTAFDRLSDQLAVAVVPADGADRAHCLIRVLGRAVLTDTLRGIGVRALPLRAA